MQIKQSTLALSQTNIHYLHAGEDAKIPQKPIMIMLHGFPENSWSWEHYLHTFSHSYHVYAPDLPGYNHSVGLGKDDNYTLVNLIACLVEFIESVSKKQKVVLVAHDWGGVIAWPLVAFNAKLISTFIIMNAAHPSTFTREMASNTLQQKRSDYITDLISDEGYDKVSANNYKMLKRLYGGWFDKLSALQQKHYLAQWSDKSSMQNSFAYYKCMPNLVTTRTHAKQNVKLPNIRILVPTLVLWGMKDTAFVPEVLDGLENWVEQLTLIKFDDADHWLHHQLPNELTACINDYLKVSS
ncbi:MAG: pimeloyl-ACP methyl ester carboxylesterase [Yoonia sp.]|jgi:pimeloyl-ACP methyl ester carboxylesterase